MTLQTLFFIVGVSGLVLAGIFGIAAVLYFVRADIRAVQADLSGKSRQARIQEFTVPRRKKSGKKVLTNDAVFGGVISQGDLATSESGAFTEGSMATGARATEREAVYEERKTSSSQPKISERKVSEGPASEGFVRRVVLVHSENVIGSGGVLLPAGVEQGGTHAA